MEYRIDRSYRSRNTPDEFVVSYGRFRIATFATMRQAITFIRETSDPLQSIPRDVLRYENGKRTWVPNPFYQEVQNAINEERDR